LPVQRISKPFKDISASFKSNPINGDLLGLTNTNAIARSIRNLIFTVPGERPFNPALGSNVNSLLFNNVDRITASSIEDQIRNTIVNFEPRVVLNDLTVEAVPDDHRFDVRIQYTIVGIDAGEQELTLALEPTR